MPNTSPAPSVATVYLNGISIGSLPVAQHQQLMAAAKRDRWLYLRQLGNTVRVAICATAKAFSLIPAVLTFLLFLPVLFAPTQDLGIAIQDIASKLTLASPQDVGRTIGSCFAFLLFISGLAVVITIFFTGARRFGFHDVFEERVNFQLRELLEAPAEGDISVIYWPAYMAEGLSSDQS